MIVYVIGVSLVLIWVISLWINYSLLFKRDAILSHEHILTRILLFLLGPLLILSLRAPCCLNCRVQMNLCKCDNPRPE